jgi:succinate-semialdehyde dehydrogenase/glutarate-semialdehyde dehydrogenase
LMAGATGGLKRLALELGGSAPVLVFPDVDIEDAAKQCVRAKFRNSGQVCISPSRFFVHETIFECFLQAAEAAVQSLVVGDGLTEGVTLGPLVTEAGRDKVESFVQDAVSKGAKVITGGRRPPALGRGFYYEPTVLTGITSEMRVHSEEVFGPVATLYRVSDIDAAIELANGTEFGLGANAWTSDEQERERFIGDLAAGMVFIDGNVTSYSQLPFGGVKNSGFGRELYYQGIREFCNIKTVWIGQPAG